MQRATVHRDSTKTQDGTNLTLVRVGAGLVGVSTRQAYTQGQSLAIEPMGHRWRAVETEGAE